MTDLSLPINDYRNESLIRPLSSAVLVKKAREMQGLSFEFYGSGGGDEGHVDDIQCKDDTANSDTLSEVVDDLIVRNFFMDHDWWNNSGGVIAGSGKILSNGNIVSEDSSCISLYRTENIDADDGDEMLKESLSSLSDLFAECDIHQEVINASDFLFGHICKYEDSQTYFDSCEDLSYSHLDCIKGELNLLMPGAKQISDSYNVSLSSEVTVRGNAVLLGVKFLDEKEASPGKDWMAVAKFSTSDDRIVHAWVSVAVSISDIDDLDISKAFEKINHFYSDETYMEGHPVFCKNDVDGSIAYTGRFDGQMLSFTEEVVSEQIYFKYDLFSTIFCLRSSNHQDLLNAYTNNPDDLFEFMKNRSKQLSIASREDFEEVMQIVLFKLPEVRGGVEREDESDVHSTEKEAELCLRVVELIHESNV